MLKTLSEKPFSYKRNYKQKTNKIENLLGLRNFILTLGAKCFVGPKNEIQIKTGTRTWNLQAGCQYCAKKFLAFIENHVESIEPKEGLSESDKKKIRTGLIAGAGAIVGMAAIPIGKRSNFRVDFFPGHFGKSPFFIENFWIYM